MKVMALTKRVYVPYHVVGTISNHSYYEILQPNDILMSLVNFYILFHYVTVTSPSRHNEVNTFRWTAGKVVLIPTVSSIRNFLLKFLIA